MMFLSVSPSFPLSLKIKKKKKDVGEAERVRKWWSLDSISGQSDPQSLCTAPALPAPNGHRQDLNSNWLSDHASGDSASTGAVDITYLVVSAPLKPWAASSPTPFLTSFFARAEKQLEITTKAALLGITSMK